MPFKNKVANVYTMSYSTLCDWLADFTLRGNFHNIKKNKNIIIFYFISKYPSVAKMCTNLLVFHSNTKSHNLIKMFSSAWWFNC